MQHKGSIVVLSMLFGFFGGAIGGGIFSEYLTNTSSPVADAIATVTDSKRVLEESSAIDVVAETQGSVVSIVITKEYQRQPQQFTNPFFNDFFSTPTTPNTPNTEEGETEQVQVGEGSGFVITEDGMILTNRHVVTEEDASYTVIFDNGDTYDATVLARDQLTDLAIMKIEAEGLKPIPLGDSETIQQGQTVIAIGNALGEYSNTVTKGIISGLLRNLGGQYSGLLQTDAAINAGNSGGPLLNLNGEVIGINTAVDRSGAGVGFAIPINEAKVAIDSVKEFGKIVRPAIGVYYLQIDEEIANVNALAYDYGAYIRGGTSKQFGVIPGSAADKAGLEEGDIILEIDGVKVDAEHSLSSIIKRYTMGDVIKMLIYHDGAEKEVELTLEALPDATEEKTEEAAAPTDTTEE